MDIEDAYKIAEETPSDINEHVPLLRALASQCESVVEFGVRGAVSTTALLAGEPAMMRSYDLHGSTEANLLEEMQGDTDFEFIIGDSLTVDIPPCDLLFIDTFHSGTQLAAELERHHAKVSRWIAIHDTEIYATHGENATDGLLPAIDAFIAAHPEWFVHMRLVNNYGMTVLSRNSDDSAYTEQA